MANEPPDLAALGRHIEERRLAAGFSAREVADAARISPAYLRVIERGVNPKTRRPSRASVDALLGIAKALDLDSRDLLALAGYEGAHDMSTNADSVPARGAVRDHVRQIQQAVNTLGDRGPFLRAQIETRLERFSADLGAIARGRLRCSPDEEPGLTQAAVRDCRKHLRAVSYQDEWWWKSKDGVFYLEEQEKLLPDVEITRVFIADEQDLESLRATFAQHDSLDLTWYAVPVQRVPAEYRSDFVIYDDKLLRRALSLDLPEVPGKSVEFTDDPFLIQQALIEFRQLLGYAKRYAYSSDRLVADSASES